MAENLARLASKQLWCLEISQKKQGMERWRSESNTCWARGLKLSSDIHRMETAIKKQSQGRDSADRGQPKDIR